MVYKIARPTTAKLRRLRGMFDLERAKTECPAGRPTGIWRLKKYASKVYKEFFSQLSFLVIRIE